VGHAGGAVRAAGVLRAQRGVPLVRGGGGRWSTRLWRVLGCCIAACTHTHMVAASLHAACIACMHAHAHGCCMHACTHTHTHHVCGVLPPLVPATTSTVFPTPQQSPTIQQTGGTPGACCCCASSPGCWGVPPTSTPSRCCPARWRPPCASSRWRRRAWRTAWA